MRIFGVQCPCTCILVYSECGLFFVMVCLLKLKWKQLRLWKDDWTFHSIFLISVLKQLEMLFVYQLIENLIYNDVDYWILCFIKLHYKYMYTYKCT